MKLSNALGYAEQLEAHVAAGSQSSLACALTATQAHLLGGAAALEGRLGQTIRSFAKHSSFSEQLRGLSASLTHGAHRAEYELAWRRLSDPSRTASHAVRAQLGHSLKSSLKHSYGVDRRDSAHMPTRGWALRTTGGTVHASQVLMATGGAPAQSDFRWFQRRLVGIGAFIVATSPLDPALIDRLLPQRRNYVTSRVMGNFFRLSPDNRLIFGGRARFAISNAKSDAKSGVILVDTMRRMFPELADVGVDHVWGGSVYVEERTVDVHIRRLRKTLEPWKLDDMVQTVRGAGYRFSANT